jgi:Tfp pilus assembly protein PilV
VEDGQEEIGKTNMNTNRRLRRGLTLVELMLAAAVLMVAVIGGMSYRYYAAMDARKADVQLTASRLAMSMLESWKGCHGLDASPAYDPTLTLPAGSFALNGVKVETSTATIPAEPTGFTSYGMYQITTAENMVYYARLSSAPAVAGASPRVLNVQIGWRMDRAAGALGAGDKVVGFTTYMAN